MEDALYTFAPDNRIAAQTAWAAAVIALAALAGTILLLRKKAGGLSHNQNMLAAMLLFFVMLISSGTAFFSWLKIRKTGTVTVYRDAVETPFGKATFSNFKDAYIYADNQPSLVSPGRTVRTTKILVIEERTGKTHAMSEADYPVKEMLPAIKNAYKNWQEKR
ncbi:MAG: hypothetical protein H6573_25400 [Lewinellaceae bacterium]|nr:hypothetical protein [Phaeodactylibacter sp.]MCB0612761.1 hypothetical protein [Phaeodactylibacter sp.]MCB9350815.1 hypothetical protein [Lewinellaceae bacterium]